MEEKKSSKKEVVKVVKELPTQVIRVVEDENFIYHLLTIEEALEEVLNKDVRVK